MKSHMKFKLRVILTIILCLVLTSLAFSSKEELKAIRAAIKAKGAHWTAGETWLSRLTPKERRKLCGEKTWEHKIVQLPITQPIVTSYLPPAAIDWRNKDGRSYVTPLKSQQEKLCGSCVSFASIATLESLICIEWNRSEKKIDLSEMHICNCHVYHDWQCCDGWYNEKACIYLRDNGAPDEACWPYVPANKDCTSNTCSNWQNRAVMISGFERIEGKDACMSCVAMAPILAVIRGCRDYDYYTGGIYEHVWGESGDPTCDHAVSIVGYDTTGETHYWIVKNSLREGYFEFIKMGECQIEYLGCYSMSGSILPPIPAAPSNLNANAPSSSTIRVTWIDHSDNESGFKIWQKKESGSWQHNCSVGTNVTSKNINGLQEGTKYYYRVRAYNVGGDSTFSNTTSETTPPNAPSNLNASTLSSSGIRVTWIDHSNKESGFEIWQKKESGSWQLKTTVGANVKSKNINGLQEGTKYYYRVRAYKGSVNSNWSNTNFAVTLPNAPSNLNAKAHSSSAIRVTWKDNSNKESGFEIWQKKGSGSWQYKCRVGVNMTSKDITGLQSGTKYCYKARAYKGSANSNWSNTDCDTTYSVPEAPSNLRATAPECFEIKLTWQDNSNNEQGFKIYRKSGSNWYQIATVAHNVTKFYDIELPCGTLFSYRVRAYNAGGNSSYSNIASAKTISCYYCRGGLSLKIIPDKKIVNSGALVTYTYKVKNKEKKDLKNIKIKDEKFGDISIEFTLEKGKSKTFIKTATLTETTTNFAEATAIYKDKNKIKSVKAHACATVEVKK